MNFDLIGGRRYVLTWAVLIVASGLLLAGKIAAADWVSIMQWSVCAYLTANVAQRHIEAQKPETPDGPR